MVLISKACTEWYWGTHTFEELNWYALQRSELQVKAEFTETCPLAAWCPAILSFQIGMGATLLNYMCLRVCGMLQSLQWCSSVSCNIQSFSSDIFVGQFQLFFSSGVPVYPASIRWVAQWFPPSRLTTLPICVWWIKTSILAFKYLYQSWQYVLMAHQTYQETICQAVLTALTNVELNLSPPSAAYLRHWIGPSMVQIMVCHLFGGEALS